MMRLILALSVIVLHHVDSTSCRSIVRKLDDLQLKYADSSKESYEMKNHEITKFLRPFVKSGQAETLKYRPLSKNLAKLFIEPYLENNQTDKWQKNPYGQLNKLKSIVPLAIILTHMPDLKSADGNAQNRNYVKDKTENNLYLNSRVTDDKTQPNIYEENPEEVQKIITNREENRVSDTEGNKERPYANNLINIKTLKPAIGEISAEVVHKSQDVISNGDRDLSDLYDNEKQDDFTDVQSEIILKADKILNEGSFLQSTKSSEIVDRDKSDSVLHGFTINLADKNNKDNRADDKIQDIIISVYSEERSSIAQNKGQSSELNQHHQNIEVTDEDYIKDHSKSVFDSLNEKPSSSEISGLISDINNDDQVLVQSKKPDITDDITENSLTNRQFPPQLDFHLESVEERGETESVEISNSAHHDHLHSYEEQIDSVEQLNKEHLIGDSHESQHKILYLHSSDEDSQRDMKNFSEELIEKNTQAELATQKPISLDTNKEINTENSIEDTLELHSQKKHKEIIPLHHEVHNWHHHLPPNVYNLYFNFNE